ncbi:thermonuclease family protein [Parasphingorhabdus marina]|uniref:thermonuclease family protein n=1 Tax=Parasphingorhabdus marina TaxID=394732 RepID=UPI00135630C4|nr:thermonuclease family protein [Parasphingorhabdus marina]
MKKSSLILTLLLIGGVMLWQGLFMRNEVLRIDGKSIAVIDGDSFKSEDEEYRLQGIDAPEFRQTCTSGEGSPWPCGRAARQQLKEILGRGVWSCTVQARDQFGRAIVTCRDRENRDLGSSLVQSGHAVSGGRFDETTYGTEESEAKKARRGIWQGPFQRPEVWRAENPRGS